MGKIKGAYLMPHPPIIMSEIGRGREYEVEKTLNSMKTVAKRIKEIAPDTIVVITPHGPVFQDAITIGYEDELIGDMRMFGEPSLKIKKTNSKELVEELIQRSSEEGIICLKLDIENADLYNIDYKLDHGVQVPLYFVDKEYGDYNLVHITYGAMSYTELYKFGMILQSVIEKSDENAVIISSGDLSHRLADKGPYDYHPDGPKFDEELLSILESGDFTKIAEIDKSMRKNAGECGLRSIEILLGAIDGYSVKPEKLSYEGTFGVGYGVVDFKVGEKSENRKIYEEILNIASGNMRERRENEDEYVKLARNSLEYYIKTGEVLDIPEGLSDELIKERAGVFVTIYKDGNLRGCIGTISPYRNSIADEIIHNAISSGTKDSRFDTVTAEDLDSLEYSVDVLMEPEKIDSISELDTKKYGVIVNSGYKRGLLLPNIDGINTPEEQVSIAMRKAGIYEDEDIEMERFEVIRHH